MEYWIYNEKTNKYICSVCNAEVEHDYDFCPICGYRHHMTTTIDKVERRCNTCEFKHLESECLGCAEYDEEEEK